MSGDPKDLPEMTKTGVRDFRLVTKNGNELIKTINNSRDAPSHPQIIKDGLEAVIREYISIIVEKASLNELVNTDENYHFLGKLDVKALFEDQKPSKTGKDPVAEKTGYLIEKSIQNQDTILKKMETLDNLDKVINQSG